MKLNKWNAFIQASNEIREDLKKEKKSNSILIDTILDPLTEHLAHSTVSFSENIFLSEVLEKTTFEY